MNAAKPPATSLLQLSTSDHSRDSAGMTYVYPVISRRAGGVSVGINLNPNNACNWHCVYCQVPNLTRGGPPPINLNQLESELRTLLQDLLQGDFMLQHVPEEARSIVDIAFSGNGEPTSADEFPQTLEIVDRVMHDFDLTGRVKLRLITNGSQLDKPSVREAIGRLGTMNGEVWFKLDAGTRSGIARINGVNLEPMSSTRRLFECSTLCPTWVQTCCFSLDGIAPNEAEVLAWLQILAQVQKNICGVHLYGLARPSMQSEAHRLGKLPTEWLEKLAERVRHLGLTVHVSP